MRSVSSRPLLQAALGTWSIIAFALPFPISIVFAGRRYGRLNRERITRLAAAGDAEGLRFTTSPSAEQKATGFVPLTALTEPLTLREGAERLIWWAIAPHGEILFEHEYSRGSGKTTTTHPHTVMVFPLTPLLVKWPFLQPGITFAVSRRASLLRGSTIPHGRPVHSWTDLSTQLTWFIEGNLEAGQRFLTPGIQQILARGPHEEWWYAGHGWLCCVFESKLDGSTLPAFLAHARSVPGLAQRKAD